jgi:hypothetical protein
MWARFVMVVTVLVFGASLVMNLFATQRSMGASGLFLFVSSILISTLVVLGIPSKTLDRRFVICVLASFSGFNLYRLVFGSSTCSCFGNLTSSVGLVLLIDVLLLTAWLSISASVLAWKHAMALVMCSLIGGVAVSIATSGSIESHETLVSADTLIGKPPAVDGKDIGLPMREVPERVILTRATCPACVSFLGQLTARGSVPERTLVYVISETMISDNQITELSRFGVGIRHAEPRSRSRYASLFSPLVLYIDNGVVVKASVSFW